MDELEHDLPQDLTVPIAEHQVLLSFRDDGGAYQFRNFWMLQGKELFETWVKEQGSS
jgi:hypothetical protein